MNMEQTINKKIQNIPALRFKEFDGEWEKKRLSTVSEKIQDGTHFSPPILDNGEMMYITSKNVRNGYLNLTNISFISKESHDKIYNRCNVRQGDVLITKDGAGTGNCCINTINEDISLLSSVAFIRANKKEALNTFIYQYIRSKYGQKEIRIQISGQAITRITLSKLKAFKFHFPTLPEQQKIASFLTAIDQKINQLSQKVALQEQYKKGVMQKIFSQELRFKDDDGNDFADWEEKKLGEICNVVGGGTPETSKKEYWNGNIQWYTPTEIKRKYLTTSKRRITDLGLKKSSAKLLPKGTLLLCTRATIAELSIAVEECTTNQGFQSLIVKSNSINEFIYYWVLNNKKEFIKRASGSTFLEISKKEIQKIKIKLPRFKEQQKIADFLSELDKQIAQTQAQLAHLQDYKKGLLQQLFV